MIVLFALFTSSSGSVAKAARQHGTWFMPIALAIALSTLGCGDAAAPAMPDTSYSDRQEASIPAPAETDTEAVEILFLGDSITAGYGVDRARAFPSVVEMRLREAGYSVNAIDAGVSGDTSTGGLNRLDWLLQRPIDILVLELGGNDGLRGLDLSMTRSNLGAIIERTRETWPDVEVVLVGMQVPPNLGRDYTREFAAMYPEVANQHETHFVAFLADGFEDIVHLLQDDGIHPTEEGHALIAEKVEAVIEPIVAQRQSPA